jgi:hypothetical protein
MWCISKLAGDHLNIEKAMREQIVLERKKKE